MYIIFSITTLLLSVFLFRHVAGGNLRLTQINIYSYIFWIPLFLLSFLGINIVANGWLPIFNYPLGVINHGYFSVLYSMIVIPAAMIVTGKIFKFNPKEEIRRFSNSHILGFISDEDSYVWFPVLLLSLFGIAAILYGYFQLENIPLLMLIQGADASELLKYRIEASRFFPGFVQIKNIFGDSLVPILSYIAFAYIFSKTTKRNKWVVLFFLLFFFSILIKSFTLAKIPPVKYILSFLPLLVIIKGKISKKLIIGFSLFLVASVIFVYISIAKVTTGSEFLSFQTGPVARILFVQIQGIFEHFSLFPEKIGFLEGASLPGWLAGLFGKTHLTSGRAVMEYLYPMAISNNTVGVMNTHFIGEAWANFGYFGVVFSPIYVGIIVQIVFIFFYRSVKTPINIGLMNYALLYFGDSIVGGFVAFIYSSIAISMIMLILFIRYFALRSADYKDKITLRPLSN